MGDTTIKISSEVRDLLAQVASERDTSVRSLVEDWATTQLETEEQRRQATEHALAYARDRMGVHLSQEDLERSEEVRAKLLRGELSEVL